MKKEELVGKKIGKLTITNTFKKIHGRNYVLCKCDCGNEKFIRIDGLTHSRTQSCGCLQKETTIKNQTKHNLTNHKLFDIWVSMKQRCTNKNSQRYKSYGARGIKVCDEWKNEFVSFYNWSMKNGYKDNLSIDRLNVNGNYEPSNCRWITSKEQANNRTTNILIEYNGISKTVKQWSEIVGITKSAMSYRFKHWSIKEAIEGRN